MLGGTSVTTTTATMRWGEAAEEPAERAAAVELVRWRGERGVSLTEPDGLLKQLTISVLETELSEEMTEHLG
jgi:putative transposase